MEERNIQTLAKDKNEFVSSIIANSKGNVVLFKRKRTLRLDPGKYDFCSGHMKTGEVPMQSMYREILEEMNISHDQISYMEKISDMETPHPKLKGTNTHLYYIELNTSIDKINELIQNVEEPELEDAEFLNNVDELIIKMQNEGERFRMEYTDEMRMALEKLKEIINRRKNQRGEKGCEEK